MPGAHIRIRPSAASIIASEIQDQGATGAVNVARTFVIKREGPEEMNGFRQALSNRPKSPIFSFASNTQLPKIDITSIALFPTTLSRITRPNIA